jgi:hypothetical protein
MGHVSYIGRVGALAVALGVGLAVANSPAIALADPGETSSTGASSSSSSSSSTSDGSPSTGVSSGSATAATSSASSTEATTDDSAQPGSSTDPQGEVVQATTTSSPPGASTTDTAESAESGSSTKPSRPGHAAKSDPVDIKQNSIVSTSTLRASSPVDTAQAAAKPSMSQVASQSVPAAVTTAVTTITSQARTAAVVTTLAPDPVIAPAPPVNIITTLVSGFLSAIGFNPQAATGPLTPPQAPMLWTLLAWVRREFEQTFLNVAPAAVTTSLVQSPNLLVNPGAELGDPSLSGYSSVTVPGWTVTGTPTVIEYGTLRRFPWPTSSPGPTFPAFLGFPSSYCAPADSGDQFFGGGPVATSTLSQTVKLGAAASDIDAGTVPYRLSGDLGGFFIDPSAASVTVDFFDADGVKLGTGQLQPVSVLDRWFMTGLFERETTGMVPVGTRSARVVVALNDCNPVLGNYNNAYADNLSLTVGAANLAPAPMAAPESKVGDLDHVFMVYMENKGFGDIVGSPNAPYLNGLIQQYGFASNYYALTHPSDPNYYPIIGGSDFGFNYNCPADCFDAPNLADNIELAGKTWAGYMEGGGGYTTPTDRLPFLAFSDIYNDPARVEHHLFDLTEMGGDLVDPNTAPDFVWFAADDGTNMEGPTDTLVGVVSWLLSQLTPKVLGGHQYNVAAGDAWLQQTLPIITDSNTWNDPGERSAIFLTFDEDYNNISLGNGNEGNHIVTVVIPSPGAVTDGMRPGAFVATDRYDHYSLLRTIEASLGLPALTTNDEFAQPMNEFWCQSNPACL